MTLHLPDNKRQSKVEKIQNWNTRELGPLFCHGVYLPLRLLHPPSPKHKPKSQKTEQGWNLRCLLFLRLSGVGLLVLDPLPRVLVGADTLQIKVSTQLRLNQKTKTIHKVKRIPLFDNDSHENFSKSQIWARPIIT